MSLAHKDNRMAAPASLSELESTDLLLNGLDFSVVKAIGLSTSGGEHWVDNPDILWVVDTEKALSATAICWASYTALGTCLKVFRYTPPAVLTKPLWVFLTASCNRITCMLCISKAWSSSQLCMNAALACAVRLCLQPHFKTNFQESDF